LFYYQIALLGSPLEPLTYHSNQSLSENIQVIVPFRNRELKGIVVGTVEKPEFETVEILENTGYYYSDDQVKTARFIADYYFASLGEALNFFIPFVCSEHQKIIKTVQVTTKINLSNQQNEALVFLRSHPVGLLFGDTGSGKTEIYMKYFEEVVTKGKQALFLMPEISLTPQMQIRLEAHFDESVVMWHSKLTKKQKEKALEKIYNGEARVIAGPRSALFLPIENLGLIVVDEEHDESYKSSSRPRYHARDMAIYIGKLRNVPVVLGSATPSLTSYAKFPHIRLKGGHFQTKRRFIFEPHSEMITPTIEHQVKATVSKGEQGIVFIPTRANFKYLICDHCGFTYECPYCSVGMSLHRNARAVKCHYCNYSEPIPQRCPKCQGGSLVSSRLGTAEAVEYFQEHLPDAVVEQFDRDVITTQNKLKAALKRFNDGETNLLVGTQMLSKGHDYHDVTLAVVLGMDNILNLSDYRAREKALSMLIQIAGRSGRKKEATVVVQTFNQEFFSAYLGNYEYFLDEEKLYREGMYPPFKKLCRILFAHKNGIKAREGMEEMVMHLQRFEKIEIVGSGASAIEKIAGKYRFQILLRAEKSTDLIKAIKAVKHPLAEVDMDPVEFH
jgi:primosomal protein N' (replication factor Y)